MANDQIYFDRMPLTATRAHSIQNTHKKYCKISNSRLCTLNSYFCLKTGAVEVEERWQKDHLLLLSDKNYLCGKLFIDLTNFLPPNSTALPAITAADTLSSRYFFFLWQHTEILWRKTSLPISRYHVAH